MSRPVQEMTDGQLLRFVFSAVIPLAALLAILFLTGAGGPVANCPAPVSPDRSITPTSLTSGDIPRVHPLYVPERTMIHHA